MDNRTLAARQFAPYSEITRIQEYGSGNVNDTFLVTQNGGDDEHFILQRINQRVFRRPELVMLNMRTFTEHVRRRLERLPSAAGRRWEIPRVLLAQDGVSYYVDPAGGFWRALTFIRDSRTFDTITGLGHASEVGHALGQFHNLISDLPTAHLHDTLEGFHITPRYLRHYDVALARHVARPSPELNYSLDVVSQRRAWATVLQEATAQGKLRARPIHGDPKVNNVMIDQSSGQAVSLIDLDTVKPGLVHYDIGDCLRSCCNPLGEETDRLGDVRFDTDLCQAFLRGYLALAREFLDENDYAYLYDCVRLITFELGLRFFTDYLEGNVYFKVKHPEHNLARALIQFKLLASIEDQEQTIRAIIGGLLKTSARSRDEKPTCRVDPVSG